MNKNLGIDVLEFSNSRAFLNRLVAGDKKGPLGVRGLARKMGLKSPSSLSMICHGKRRLTTAGAEKLAKGLALTGRRKSYLLAMVRYEMAQSEDEKFEAHEQLLKLKSRREETPLSKQQYRCLSHWYYPAIYELAAFKNFKEDTAWLCARLGKSVTPAEVRKALDDLINLGLLERHEGKIRQTNGAMTTAEDLQCLAIQHYHQEMLSRAKVALRTPLEKREMNGLTVRVSQKKLPQIKARIREFRKELNEILSSEPDADEVYQLNIHFFPLTVGAESGEER